MYIIKGMFKLTLGIILTGITLAVLFPGDGKEDCYWDASFGDGLNNILVGNVVSEAVLPLAKYGGAEADGYLVEETKKEDGSWTVEVAATLRAKNAFGVYSTSYYTVKAELLCNGYNVISITK